jgi:NADH-ubiquinone oxidoreductase chain 3
MSSLTFFFLFVSILAVVFLVVNLLLAPHNPYQEKYSIFECGFHSFIDQNRKPFGAKFYLFGILYLVFDLEVQSLFPFLTSSKENGLYGLTIFILFSLIVTIGFVFELGKKALNIDSRQTITSLNEKSPDLIELISNIYNKNKK